MYIEANERLGFSEDGRSYQIAQPMLAHFGITKLRLMTNKPRKIAALEIAGVAIAERIPLILIRNIFNSLYLDTKAAKLGHLIPNALSQTVATA